jgi:FHA domain-containing protein/DNA translocase FtsK/SpoIIIE-like protein
MLFHTGAWGEQEEPMQIRLTVLVPRGDDAPRPCDLLVTAPAGTVLASVAGGLTSAALAAAADPAGAEAGEAVPALFAGSERLDPQRQLVGEPPLVDGAVLSLHAPFAPPALDAYGAARARLHVESGPDAGGIHLLHGGRVRLGRSAEADVVLDDPDVSRLHCAVTVLDGGEVTVTDLGSTNGTSVDGRDVDDRPTLLGPDASLYLGESALRLVTSARPAAPPELVTTPDGEGRLRLGGGTDGPGLPNGTGLAGPWAAAAPAEGSAAGSVTAEGLVPGQPAPPTGEPTRITQVPHAPTVHGTGSSAADAPAGLSGPAGPGETPRRRNRGIGAWARLLGAGGTDGQDAPGGSGEAHRPVPAGQAAPDDGRWPDPATVLLTALGPGHRLWERDADHPDALAVRIGTTHHTARRGDPLIVDLTSAGGLGVAGPRPRLASLARSVLAQLATLHAPDVLEMVLIAADPAREAAERVREWAWLGWLPHLRPRRGQDCRLLTAFDHSQATARAAELTGRLGHVPEGDGMPARTAAPVTVLVVDGDPGTPALRDAVIRLATEGPAAGVHVVCLAETPAASPASPLEATIAAAHAASPAFRPCRTLALLSGAVATAVRVVRRGVRGSTVATIDGVSGPWADRWARALAPLREAAAPERPDGQGGGLGLVRAVPVTLPTTCRLLDELGLARATPAAVLARWPEAPAPAPAPAPEGVGAKPAGPPRATLVFGAGRRGSVVADLVAAGHGLVTGPAGSGKTELLHALAASLAAGERPERLQLTLVEGMPAGRGEGLRACADLPHVTGRLTADDPVRMREYAQGLVAELKRRATLVGPGGFEAGEITEPADAAAAAGVPAQRGHAGDDAGPAPVRLSALPRLVVLVDDFDALVDPPLGSPGRPAAGSVVRALEAVARDGAALGVHLLATAARPDRAAHTETVGGAGVRAELTGRDGRAEVPGRGVVRFADGTASEVQAGRVRGRIPRTATVRPTVVPLDWARSGDPPTRRPVRELGNGPTDLALLASAMDRAARTGSASSGRGERATAARHPDRPAGRPRVGGR